MDWNDFLAEEREIGGLEQIEAFLDQEYETKMVYPPREKLYAAFDLCPLDQVRVVILGQDPYHEAGQAQGLAFSVPEGMRIPPSLVNIYKEIEDEYHVCLDRSGDLSDWAGQGVLLINRILTVEEGRPLSHAKIGWSEFTDDLLDLLNDLDQPIVFLLWGAHARSAKKWLTNPKHLVLESAHPSPLSARRGFFKNGHFQAANAFLKEHGEREIDWCSSNRHAVPEIESAAG